MKKDNSISKSDFQKQIEAVNNETKKIEEKFKSALHYFQDKELRYLDIQRIVNNYLNSIVSIHGNVISTNVWIDFTVSNYLDVNKDSKYFKLMEENENNNNRDKVCNQIQNEMKKYVQSLIDELNTMLNIKLYIKEIKPFSYCFIVDDKEGLSLPYFMVNVDIQ